MVSIKQRLSDDTKEALRSGEKQRLGVLRLASAAIKQREIDQRTDLDDTEVIAILGKMVKQGEDAARQFREGDRADLADREVYEISVLRAYLPQQLDAKALEAMVDATLARLGASSPGDMGKVMGALKKELAGRADLGALSGLVKSRLS